MFLIQHQTEIDKCKLIHNLYSNFIWFVYFECVHRKGNNNQKKNSFSLQNIETDWIFHVETVNFNTFPLNTCVLLCTEIVAEFIASSIIIVLCDLSELWPNETQTNRISISTLYTTFNKVINCPNETYCASSVVYPKRPNSARSDFILCWQPFIIWNKAT